ncbi:lipoyl(octanoyl) transferase LipB [Methylococcus capsulatus]|uniref:Octanoyltransferase n=1 Tax=Methylococcus capsulatus (strain ATCC 33009 / NCIMB 11132 / Bath) TaxID=243233 RepID=LIPB_METCA|nr:lipoyl(octanoyl) transferase LipB [Methylococcus capsulatus]Q60CJ7.1 RecName: Full=Octanoyltransferase; AltName: Full=Lipoate-protein ligase B; AltName: Full=Lipoyl/octanoyl transferase; AltName: Full=Octanoyl-[acyl-carrier-protein]-protein N-octanoyltransferase [Methylococcus capsulatus str. Bath]AAU90701.1 lipoate-protein ligase B [Methylococcus capsulatus str. Bath]QXP86392.1 lipoyl(octanoyl) transferase LipB [Methylococcus capsulatus]QXP89391.1 lipoyl(octanoyl) transferase LipB [Methyloc
MAFLVRMLGRADYEPVWRAMQEFTGQRADDTADELWLVEHPPVYTLGMNGDPAHILDAGGVPVVRTDRGGQVTYHGPGQLVLYTLVDLQRRKLGVRRMVSALEQAVIGLLRQYGLEARARGDAPGVYVDGAKIASLGLRVRRGCCYHGVALNVCPELEAFDRIHPCGHAGLAVTRLTDLGVEAQVFEPAAALVRELMVQLGDEEIAA